MTRKTQRLFLSLTLLTLTALAGCKKTNKSIVTTIDRSHNGTYQEGPWAYVLSINTGSSNNQGIVGYLYYLGTRVPTPDNLGDYYETTLGTFHYVGVTPGTKQNPILPWDDQGWIQLKPKEKPSGQKLSPPTILQADLHVNESNVSSVSKDPNETTENGGK